VVEVGTRASEAEGPFSRREEGWELGEKESKSKSKSKRVEIQPTHRSGMGLKAFLQGEGGEVVGLESADQHLPVNKTEVR